MQRGDVTIRFQVTRGHRWYEGVVDGLMPNGQVRVAHYATINGVTRWWAWHIWPHQARLTKGGA